VNKCLWGGVRLGVWGVVLVVCVCVRVGVGGVVLCRCVCVLICLQEGKGRAGGMEIPAGPPARCC